MFFGIIIVVLSTGLAMVAKTAVAAGSSILFLVRILMFIILKQVATRYVRYVIGIYIDRLLEQFQRPGRHQIVVRRLPILPGPNLRFLLPVVLVLDALIEICDSFVVVVSELKLLVLLEEDGVPDHVLLVFPAPINVLLESPKGILSRKAASPAARRQKGGGGGDVAHVERRDRGR